MRLLNPPHPNEAAEVIAVFAETTFGDIGHPYDYRGTIGGDDKAWALAQGAAEFKHVIPNALETVTLTFAIDGISRATTHQLVRSRVGAVFGQFSQRANNLSGFNMRLPDSFEVMPSKAVQRYEESLAHLRRFYEAAIEAGVPYQDARYVVPEGVETTLTASYNLLSLIGTIQRRICNRMQWEVNYVARLMADEVVRALPWVGLALRSRCEASGTCQTVDPMFEPSCLYWDAGNGTVAYCKDNAALKEQLGSETYNWLRDANSAFVEFYVSDHNRVEFERGVGGRVLSASTCNHTTTLAAKDEGGLWRAHLES